MSEKRIVFLKRFKVLEKLKEEFLSDIKYTYAFQHKANECNIFIITNEDKVYGFGYNKRGVLGFGHDKNVKLLTLNEELSNKQIIGFKDSFWHVMARTIDGKVYCWGRNVCSGLGNAKRDNNFYKPKLNQYLSNEQIIDICCDESQSFALTQKGEVYGWGVRQEDTVRSESQLIPIKLIGFNNEKVVKISCGFWHSMALTESGHVYSWGSNQFGQLGRNDKVDTTMFTLFMSLYTLDINNLFSGIKSRFKPSLVSLSNDILIKKISCGSAHSLLLSSDGDIYWFGNNGCETQMTPKKLTINAIKFIDIATHFYYDISIALSDNNVYYFWGKYGEELIKEPKETELKSFDEIFANYINLFQTNLELDFVPNGKYKKEFIELSEIGRGSYGKVFKVENNITHEITAIKRIPVFDENESFNELLNSIIISKIDIPFIARFHDVWYENETGFWEGFGNKSFNSMIYIQMDFCEKNLEEIKCEIKNDIKLKINEMLTLFGYFITSELFIEILNGVQYLHQKNIIHRDLKPDNILLTENSSGNYIKIADFGLAKVHETAKTNTADKGTPKYMAPEVVLGKRYDLKADIHSLGVIMEEIFYIDMDEAYNEQNSGHSIGELLPKYKSAKKLVRSMTDRDQSERPDCQKILDEKNVWTLNRNEFNFEEDLRFFKEHKNNNLFLYSMIISKLSCNVSTGPTKETTFES